VILRSHQKRIIDALRNASKGCVYCPTGGGKTLTFILDAQRRLEEATTPQVIVVVAPRILLAEQLCSEFLEVIDMVNVLHVHSGETHHERTTNSGAIAGHVIGSKFQGRHLLIFTTYNSLSRIIESDANIDTIYFDEAHNCYKRNFFVSVAIAADSASNAFFFTATPKYSKNANGRGMNNTQVYGSTLISVPAAELVANGSIVPPTVVTHQTNLLRSKDTMAKIDSQTVVDILDNLDETQASKVLVAAPNTKVLWSMLSNSDVLYQMELRGYDVMHITAKHGAYINKTKVDREKFFDTLTAWGKDPNRKFVLFHYSILSEGINCPGLTHCILLRNLGIIEMAQTIGRVIRIHKDDAVDIANGKIPAGKVAFYRKPTGYVTVPVHTNHGTQIAKRLQAVVDTIFIKGIPAHSLVA
jgi:superfamily II DNA or RNA helicase